MEKDRTVLIILTEKLTGKSLSGRPRFRWEDNIRIDLKEIGVDTRNWVESDQETDYWISLLNAALNLRVQQAMELVAHSYI